MIDTARGKAGLDPKAPGRARLGVESGTVGGETAFTMHRPRPNPSTLLVSLTIQAFEGPVQSPDLVWSYDRPVVGDAQERRSRLAAGCDGHASTWDIVAQRVVEEIRREPLDEAEVALQSPLVAGPLRPVGLGSSPLMPGRGAARAPVPPG